MFNSIKIFNILNKIYFTFDELKCKCGCETLFAHEEFVRKFLLFRIFFNVPFTPTSFYRCKNHKDYSTNHYGWAADIPYDGKSQMRFSIISAALQAGFKRIGIASNFIHIDCNPEYNGTWLEEVIWLYERNEKECNTGR